MYDLSNQELITELHGEHAHFAFKEARRRLGLSFNELADAFRLDERTLRRWEAGDRQVPQSVLILLELCLLLPDVCEYLGIDALN